MELERSALLNVLAAVGGFVLLEGFWVGGRATVVTRKVHATRRTRRTNVCWGSMVDTSNLDNLATVSQGLYSWMKATLFNVD